MTTASVKAFLGGIARWPVKICEPVKFKKGGELAYLSDIESALTDKELVKVGDVERIRNVLIGIEQAMGDVWPTIKNATLLRNIIKDTIKVLPPPATEPLK